MTRVAVSTSLGAHYAVISVSTPQGVHGQKAGKRILFRSYPAMREKSWDLDKPDRLLAGLAESNEIPLLALEPVFRRLTREEGRSLHWKRDGWLNDTLSQQFVNLPYQVPVTNTESGVTTATGNTHTILVEKPGFFEDNGDGLMIFNSSSPESREMLRTDPMNFLTKLQML